MKRLLIGLATAPFLAGVAMAGQPMPLSDVQMDKVTAGYEANTFAGTIQYLELSFPPLTVEALVPLTDTGEDAHGGIERIFQTAPLTLPKIGS
jgi:hypothetical protein